MSLGLFLPGGWFVDPERCVRAGVPGAEVAARTKSGIALAGLDRVRAAGARRGCVLADAGYDTNAAFRHALNKRGLLWVVGVARDQKAHAADVQVVAPAGRARAGCPTNSHKLPRMAGPSSPA